ncbi:adenylate/guanylate cyclase domain-containing protein [Stigmatella aurantiaca]|uniref:Adenylate and Guanylate cyclase catalytic domain protein n=1 Tax=Stigmatella aurantiaca (strain DW4/3-1) TaxID=378806 RepID=E3FW21_STIAD|nr:adenylate/guanylate cyclase domain-containing protein [Stigmatella aurantiaca]ADO74742.1 Adenylate and Guanylate cyclase catalytic domain protein [Stigmatella aurantiaca DW4/3-1]
MWLIVNPGLSNEQPLQLPEGHSTIGRTGENTFRVLHLSLSRRHARLERIGTRVVLVDLGSKNGTLVKGTRVERYELRDGDSFQCGDVLFKIASVPDTVEPTHVQDLKTRFSLPAMEELLERERTAGSQSALKVRQARQAALRSAEKLEVLLKVSQLLSSAGPIDGLLERIAQLVFQILDVDRVVILLVDPLSGELRPRVARFLTGEVPSGAFYSQHVVDYVRTHSVAALFADALDDPRLTGADSVMLQSIRSAMCVPLKPQETVLGVLYVDNLARVNGFTEEDLEFLTAFGNQAAIALENSLLSERLAEEAALRNSYLRFFPPSVIKKLRSARGAPLDIVETEVTVLFSDITGFTSLSSTLHPRQVVDLLNDYFPIMADIVFRHEGTLEKYIGDALMAVWGAPFSQPDDADRALRAAVEMQRALADLNAHWREQGRPEIQIHVGLNTGRVAAGNIGSEHYLQYATIGDATNVASRICDATHPAEICLSEATLQRCQACTWPLTKLPPLQVKGKAEPLTLYRLEWRDAPGR